MNCRQHDNEPAAPVDVPGVVDQPTQTHPATTPARGPFARFRRRIRRRGLDRTGSDPVEGGLELTLDLMLMREENVRLKSERHRPFDVGTLIDQLRLRTAEIDRAQTPDDALSLLGEYLLLRENLAQADVEIEAAITAIGERYPVLAAHVTPRQATPAANAVAMAA